MHLRRALGVVGELDKQKRKHRSRCVIQKRLILPHLVWISF